MSNYIDLHCHSTFSCAMTSGDAYGTPKEIVARAVELGWGAVCLTDHGWMGGAPALYKEARKAGIKPILGCELYVTPDFAHGIRGKEVDGMTFHLTVLALSREGYQNLVTWTTEAMQRENYHRKPRISLMQMAQIAPHGLHHNVVMSGCLASELCRTVQETNGNGEFIALDYIEQMKLLFPNFYIELFDHEIPKFVDEMFPAYVDLIEREAVVRDKLIALAEASGTPMVLTNDSHMQHARDRAAHIALKSAGWRGRDDAHYGKSTASVSSKYLKDYAYFGNYMRSLERIVANGAGIPDEAIESVAEIVEAADIQLEPLDNFSYSIPSAGYEFPAKRIRRKCRARLQAAIEKHGDVAAERFELELAAMEPFADYLLLMANFIEGAHQQGILTWTRGSAANSFLAYCLGIHELDSIEYGLLFSRFYNPARKKLPDIDVDIDPERYEDFMRIVQEHMEPLVGEGQVEQICNWGTAANRQAFRMAATSLGMPKEVQDDIAKLLPQMIDEGMVDEGDDIFIELREDYPELYEISSSIFDSIRNVSQHACAWVFGTPERKIAEWIPMYLIASSGKLVTQFDFKTMEDFGLTKMDFLRLKTLTIASKTLRAAGRSPLEFYDLPVDDEATFEMIRAGNVEGVHTLQGKETRKGVVEIQVEDVHDVILAAALYRPANTREHKDRLYNARRRGEETVEYAHPALERVLGPTQGIAVFQEQAMEIGYAFGMDDAGVDDVYQAIKKAKGAGRGAKEAFAEIQPTFEKGAKKFSRHVREVAWETIKSFQGYGFNKGHATSYGVLAVKMGYLRCHYLAEFMASLLDVFPEKPAYIASARAEGFQFAPPDVNYSGRGFTLEKTGGKVIRVGVTKIKNLGPVGTQQIIDGQPFTDLDDFKARTTRRAVHATRIEILGDIGALECLGIGRDPQEDETQFLSLGFTLRKPRAFRGCKPRFTGTRESSSGWKHLGRTKGMERTETRCSVSKMFWLPPGAKLELKASPWAQVKTWLLEVLDENGVKFHLMVNEDKEHDVRLLKFLHGKCQGAVLCADGMIRLPFVQNGPQGFRFFGVTGSFDGDPQLWKVKKEKLYRQAIAELFNLKRRSRASA